MALSSLLCGNCGVHNTPGESFCDACGYTLTGATSVTAVPTTPAPITATVPSTPTGQLPARMLLKQRYLVLHTVGQGGMGAVYMAQDTQLGNRLVAVKEMVQSNLSGQPTQDAVESFKGEAHLLAGLQHPNLPSIYDYFAEAGRWYLLMSFIEGETLEDYLARAQGQKLTLEETLRIGLTLCDVLSYLHAHNPPIIFRDLKPSNIMRSADGHLYLIDFGIARHFKPGQAKDTASYGSMGYAPPEQYGKAQTTERADIYSLGATLYECLSGYDPAQSPFRFPPLQSLVPTLPAQLVTLITQMLELDESKRPVSVKMVEQALQLVSAPAVITEKASTPPRHYAPVPIAPKRSTAPFPMPYASVPGKPIQQQLYRAKPSSASTQPKVKTLVQSNHKKRMPFAMNPKAISFFWMIFGVLFLLNGVTGPFRFDLETAGGIFGAVTICGFSGLFGLITMLLAHVKDPLPPMTKARHVEFAIAQSTGIVAMLFGALITIIGVTIVIITAITHTSTNSNEIGIYLGIFLAMMGFIALRVTRTRITKTP